MSPRKPTKPPIDLENVPVEQLLAEVARRRATRDGVDLMSAMEMSVEEAKQQFGRAALEAMIERLGPEDDAPKACPKCGKPVRVRARARERRVRTLSGTVRVVRNYHYCRACKHGFCPRDGELGLPERGSLTREMERRVIDLALNSPFAEVEERWRVHYSEPISSNLARRVTDRVGARCEACHDAALDYTTQSSPKKPPELIIVQSDGAHLPVRGKEPWKENKLAVIVDAESYARRRGTQRGLIAKARYVGVLGGQAEFRGRVDKALRIERAGAAKHVAWVGDGASGNWTLADACAPGSIQVLDWYHAMEHAIACGSAVLEDEPDCMALWRTRVEQLLWSGEIAVLIEELGDCVDISPAVNKTPLWELLRYYRTNRARMDYPRFRALGIPIGSGIVESGHRHVIQRRMKNAGQRWSLHRARRMVRMRCAYQTAGARRFYAAVVLAERLTRTGKIPRAGWKKTRASNRG
jgi:hypothetical protein